MLLVCHAATRFPTKLNQRSNLSFTQLLVTLPFTSDLEIVLYSYGHHVYNDIHNLLGLNYYCKV